MSVNGETLVDVGTGVAPQAREARFNAVKHGLTAKTAVLPGEDPAALQGIIAQFKATYGARNPIEESLAEMAAMTFWRAKRADRLEVARLTRDIVTRQQADAAVATPDVAGLADRLFFDRRGPWQLYPSREFEHREPRTSSAGEPDDPDEPGKVLIEIEATREGRCWLRETWGELRKPLESGGGWVSCQKFQAIRLLGKQPLDAIHNDEVALVFLASHAIHARFSSAFHELRCEIHQDQVKTHMAQLARDELKAITPANAEAGRAALLAIVDMAVARLWKLESESSKAAEILDQIDTSIVSDKEMKTCQQAQRHFGDCNRLMVRNIDAFHRSRRNEIEGWGKVRLDRERRKEEARRKREAGPDPRVVMDERGTVRQAEGYKGNLGEGLRATRQRTDGNRVRSKLKWNTAGERLSITHRGRR